MKSIILTAASYLLFVAITVQSTGYVHAQEQAGTSGAVAPITDPLTEPVVIVGDDFQRPIELDYQWTILSGRNGSLPESISFDSLLAFTDEERSLWITTKSGLAKLVDGRWEEFASHNDNLFENEYVVSGIGIPTSVAFDRQGGIWIGTRTGALVYFDGENYDTILPERLGLPDNSPGITDLALGPGGYLWAATGNSGVLQIDVDMNVLKRITQGHPNSTYPSINRILFDIEGNLWAATNRGLLVLRKNTSEFELVFAPKNETGASGAEDVTAIALANDKTLWAAHGSSLLNVDPSTGEILEESFEIPFIEFSGISNLSFDYDNTLWIGTDHRGIIQKRGGLWRLFDEVSSHLPSDWVGRIIPGDYGSVWVKTGDSIARLQPVPTMSFSLSDRNRFGDFGSEVTFGHDGTLWFSEAEGLFSFANGAWVQIEEGEGVTESGLASHNSGWLLAAYYEGLQGYNGREWIKIDSWKNSYGAQHADVQINPDGLAVAANGDIWLGTTYGLSMFDESEGLWTTIDPVEFSATSYTATHVSLSDEEAVWIAGAEGVQIGEYIPFLARFQDGMWTKFTQDEFGLQTGASVRNIAVGKDGSIWWNSASVPSLVNFDPNLRVARVFDGKDAGVSLNLVYSLAVAPDGAVWAGAQAGVVRLLNNNWRVFNGGNTEMSRPWATSIAFDQEGSTWIATINSELVRIDSEWAEPTLSRIDTLSTIQQSQHTFAVRAFDPSYRTQSHEMIYEWELRRKVLGGTRSVASRKSNEPILTLDFEEDGDYELVVRATDYFGASSTDANFDFSVELPKIAEKPWWQSTTIKIIAALTPVSYLVLMIPLIGLYHRSAAARSLANSGIFDKFPVLHRMLLNTDWARRNIFWRYSDYATAAHDTPNYISQKLYTHTGGKEFEVASAEAPFGELFQDSRHAILLGRSGTGKSVLMRRLFKLGAERFRSGNASIPILINAPYHLQNGVEVAEAAKQALRRDGKVELPDRVLDHLLSKGGFVLLIDSLNENEEAATQVSQFANRDVSNNLIVASQSDLLRREDVTQYRISEVSEPLARLYIDSRCGDGTWETLTTPLIALSMNPMDLDLIAEVILALGIDNLPRKRAELYNARIKMDTALKDWVGSANPRLGIIYEIAYRMLRFERTPDQGILAQWIRELLDTRELGSGDIGAVVSAISSSKQFSEITKRDPLGRPVLATTFDHELVGKFLASRHLAFMLKKVEQRPEALLLVRDKAWQDVFFFMIDEATAPELLDLLLADILTEGGTVALEIVAYAISTKSDSPTPLPDKVTAEYTKARLREDLRQTSTI